jgi:hypothetical protein
MRKSKRNNAKLSRNESNTLYQRADKEWRRGRLRSAFRLFLAAAKAGIAPAFFMVGSFYDQGDGVRANENAALYWYRRAYRHRDSSAANNIACILRDRGKITQALKWFRRAASLGNDDANLTIAKIYLRNDRNSRKAVYYLAKTRRSRRATEASIEEAERLLRKLKPNSVNKRR